MSSTEVTDAIEATISAAAAGDSQAWAAIFDHFGATIYRYAMAHLRDRHAAEDLTQDVFVAAVQGIARLKDRSPVGFESWLIAIARNKSADRIRELQRNREASSALAAAPAADAEDAAMTHLRLDDLYRAMALLSDDQRDLLVRRFVLDQPLELVARATRRRVGAVKAMQHRALASLSRSLAKEEHP